MRGSRVRLLAVGSTVLLGMAGIAFGTMPAQAVGPMAKGNVLLSIGGGKFEEHTPAGALVQTGDSTTATTENDGMCFDSSGNLYATNGFSYGSVAKFAPDGTLVNKDFIKSADTAGGHPESCVVDSAGNVFVGLPDSSPDALQKYSPTGALLNTFPVTVTGRGTDWIDLAKDQCTIFYTSEGSTIQRYNTCTQTQLADFATGLPSPCYGHRLLADSSVLVACSGAIVHLSSTGTVLNTFTQASLGFTAGGFLFAMNLDPDGTTFWTANYSTGQVVRAKISDGSAVGGFNHTAGNGPFGGLTVVGELTQGIPPTTTTTSTAAPTTTATAAPAPATAATPAFTG
jgi:hypothetical protein